MTTHLILIASTDAEKAAVQAVKFALDRYLAVRSVESNLLVEGDLISGPHQTLDVVYNQGGEDGEDLHRLAAFLGVEALQDHRDFARSGRRVE